MKIVIIEDEKITARDLAGTIEKVAPLATVIKMIASVREGIAWFSEEREVELIFADIQLGDGTSFNIFSQSKIKAPVIFCTAYDEYALEAFGANGIDYILKPFSDETVRAAIMKFISLKGSSSDPSVPRRPQTTSILVYQQDRILPIAIEDAAFFYYANGMVSVTTFDNVKYSINKSMDEIAKLTEPVFFRANRQFLIHRRAVLEITNSLSRKLSLRLAIATPEDVTVSREKMSSFLDWLTRQ
jgi:DNA-binding LytR/AlgR family response regulator